MSNFVSDNPVQLLSIETAFPGSPVVTDELIESLGRHCTDPAIPRRARAVAHRLGISSRYLSRDLSSACGTMHAGCDSPALGAQSLKKALSSASLGLEAVEYLIGHTTTPHTLLPPNISWIAEHTNFTAPYMELRQACTGFANALQIASAMIAANGLNCVGIIGSEVGSAFFRADDDFADMEQLINYVQMGDGAATALIGPPNGSGRALITDIFMGHIGNGRRPGLSLLGGGSALPNCTQQMPVFAHHAQSVKAFGPALFKQGVEAVKSRGYSLDDFRFIIPHQANGRLSKPLANFLCVAEETIYCTAGKYGNLGSAAIWAALADLLAKERLEANDKVLILGAEATKYMYGGFVYTH